ncbi:MAG: sterol desaturase family protein [Rhodovibrio sp.]|nr:sterol desaturase family protein [Rhodovibrio sp.]
MYEALTSAWASVFYAAVILLALGELLIPARQGARALDRRWSTNIGLYLLNMLLHRFLGPVLAVVVGYGALAGDVGVFAWLAVPALPAIVAGILLLDLWKYVEHRLMHAVPLLWRLHLVHHSDTDVDFTTAERHHPLEVVIGTVGFVAVTVVFAIPPLAIALYALIATIVAVFSHANIQVGRALDRPLSWVIVTPAVHNVHHSAERAETDSNFGLMMTLWDRLFGTYTVDTPHRAAARQLGLEYFRNDRDGWLDRVLLQPFTHTWARAKTLPPSPTPGERPSPPAAE